MVPPGQYKYVVRHVSFHRSFFQVFSHYFSQQIGEKIRVVHPSVPKIVNFTGTRVILLFDPFRANIVKPWTKITSDKVDVCSVLHLTRCRPYTVIRF